MAQGYSVLFEGAQATLLDLDHGTYPFVTSSSAVTAGGVAAGLGVAAHAHRRRPRHRQGLHHARGRRAAALRDRRRARGGDPRARPRVRRLHRPPAPLRLVRRGRRALLRARERASTRWPLTKLDVLDELAEIQVCTGYRFEGETLADFPGDISVLEACEPVYETLPGWRTSTAGVRDFDVAAGGRARRYVDRLSELVRRRDRHRLDRPRPRRHDRPRPERAVPLVRIAPAPRATITLSGARRNAGRTRL